VIPGYRRSPRRCTAHRTPIFAQINHNGGQASSMYTRLPVWAPSAVADPLFREVPKAVDQAEIAEIIAGYALVASNCAEGGFDGIELQCSHSSIVRGFLSPATNRRTDGYGGSLENRARLLLELVVAVRAAIGVDLALGVRLCGDELIEGGTTIDDAVAVAKMVEATGRSTTSTPRSGWRRPAVHDRGVDAHPARVCDVHPVGAARGGRPARGRRRPLQGPPPGRAGAHRGPVRPGRRGAGPDRRRRLRRQARAGQPRTVPLCLSCNQECVGRMGLNRWLGCIENPRTGREAEGVGEPVRVTSTKRVLVVGGAGRVAGRHRRGAQRPPGDACASGTSRPAEQVRLAASVPNRAEFGDLVRNQFAEATRLGVRSRPAWR
jgi:hypothetical protein